MECFRRFALTGLAVFIYPESSAQVAVVLLLAAVFMVVSEILAPFERPVDMWLYRMGHYVVFASMFLALLLRVDVSNEREQSQEVFSGVIIIAHAAMLLVVVAQGLVIFMGWEELVEVPDSLKDPVIVAGGDYEKGEPGSGIKPGPRGGLGLAKNADPLAQQEQREKRWETWERVAPTAKSSFFPTPSRRRGSRSSSRVLFQSVSPTSSVQWSEKAGASRSCRSLSSERRSVAGGTDGAGNSSSNRTADTRVFAYVKAPPKNRERDGFKAAMTAAGFVIPKTKSLSPRHPNDGSQDVVDTSARTVDISARSRFGISNSVLAQAEPSSSRPPAEEKGDNCASPTQQPDDKARMFRSWSPRQRFRSARPTAKLTMHAAAADKRVLKRRVAAKQDPDATPTDTVIPAGGNVSNRRSPTNATATEPGTRMAASSPAVRPRIASSLGSTVSPGVPARDSRTPDASIQAAFPPAETSETPTTDVRKHTNRTRPGRRTGENKPSRTKVSPSVIENSRPNSPPAAEDLPLARSSPLHQRKIYIPGWRLVATEETEPGVKCSDRGRQQKSTGLETSARGGEKQRGQRHNRRVDQTAAQGGHTIETGPEIVQNGEHRTAGELPNRNTDTPEEGTDDPHENVPNARNEVNMDGRRPVGWRSVPGVATGTGGVKERPKVRDGWAPRYPVIRPSPTL